MEVWHGEERSSGDFGPAGPQNPFTGWGTARLWHRAPYSAGFRRVAECGRGITLSSPASHGAKRMDPLGVGAHRDQPEGEILPAYGRWAETVGRSRKELRATRKRYTRHTPVRVR